MKYREMVKEPEGQLVLEILEDLESRKGLGDMWDEMDDETKKEVFEAWFHIVYRRTRERGPIY